MTTETDSSGARWWSPDLERVMRMGIDELRVEVWGLQQQCVDTRALCALVEEAVAHMTGRRASKSRPDWIEDARAVLDRCGFKEEPIP